MWFRLEVRNYACRYSETRVCLSFDERPAPPISGVQMPLTEAA